MHALCGKESVARLYVTFLSLLSKEMIYVLLPRE